MSSIKYWPKDDRPREKLLREGEHKLSDTELLAIILRTGTNGRSAVDLAREILQKFKTLRNMSHIDLSLWNEIKGLGAAKITQIKAAIELGRRLSEESLKEDKPKIKSSQDIVKIFMPRMRDLKKEIFKIVFLNSQYQILETADIEEGTVNQANPIVREVFQKALQFFSSAIICLHNHPSGNPQPSQEDKDFTRDLAQAGVNLHIKILDHIIIGNDKHFSFKDEDLL